MKDTIAMPRIEARALLNYLNDIDGHPELIQRLEAALDAPVEPPKVEPMTPTWEDGTEPLVGGGLVQAGKVDRQVRAALAAAKEVQPQSAYQDCLRCTTPAKCHIYGCSPLTWPSEQAAAKEVQAQPQPMNSWQQAIDDEMVTLHLGGAWGDPKACLKELLDWHVSVALDPSVSSDAASLVDRGRAEAKTRVATLEALVSELDRESRQNWALYVEVSADARALQAKLDRLMFEYCPEDMTAEQVETWAKHQRMNRSLETLKKVNQG